MNRFLRLLVLLVPFCAVCLVGCKEDKKKPDVPTEEVKPPPKEKNSKGNAVDY